MVGPATIAQIANLQPKGFIKLRSSPLSLLLIQLLLYILRIHLLIYLTITTTFDTSSSRLLNLIHRHTLRLLELPTVAYVLHQLLPRPLVLREVQLVARRPLVKLGKHVLVLFFLLLIEGVLLVIVRKEVVGGGRTPGRGRDIAEVQKGGGARDIHIVL